MGCVPLLLWSKLQIRCACIHFSFLLLKPLRLFMLIKLTEKILAFSLQTLYIILKTCPTKRILKLFTKFDRKHKIKLPWFSNLLKTKYKIVNLLDQPTFNTTWKTHQFHHHRPCIVKPEGALLRHCNSENWVRFASDWEIGSEFLNEISHSLFYHCNFTQMVSKISLFLYVASNLSIISLPSFLRSYDPHLFFFCDVCLILILANNWGYYLLLVGLLCKNHFNFALEILL